MTATIANLFSGQSCISATCKICNSLLMILCLWPGYQTFDANHILIDVERPSVNSSFHVYSYPVRVNQTKFDMFLSDTIHTCDPSSFCTTFKELGEVLNLQN